jgi:hypothetical protein
MPNRLPKKIKPWCEQSTQAKKSAFIVYVFLLGGIYLLMNQKALADAANPTETEPVEPIVPILTNHVIHPYVATELNYDANLFRLPKDFRITPDIIETEDAVLVIKDLLATKAMLKKSSFIEQLKAGITAKWQISQQEFLADLNINQNWFSTFHEMDYTGHSVLGQWNWQFTQRWKGELAYSNNLRLAGFRGINKPVHNLESRESYVAKGGYEIFPDWFIRAGFDRFNVHYPDNQERQLSDLIQNTTEFGIRYSKPYPLENILGFFIAITDAKYPNRDYQNPLDNAYTRTTYMLESMWNYSVKTRFRAKVGYLSQVFKHQSQLNFSNIIAEGDIFWKPSDKSSLYLEVWREIYSADNLIATFSLYQGIRLTPTWTWSPKLQIELPISYELQNNIGLTKLTDTSITPVADSIAPRSEQSIVRLNINYIPLPNIEMIAFASYEHRHSNNPVHTYQDELVGLTIKANF